MTAARKSRGPAVLDLAARPDGVTNRCLQQALALDSRRAAALLYSMQRRKLLFVAPGGFQPLRCFPSEAAAQAWASHPRQLGHRAGFAYLQPVGQRMRTRTQQPSNPPPALPGSLGLAPLGQTRGASGNAPLVTRGPSYSHDPRYQCGPDEVVYGAGFAARLPGIDIETGRPWAPRVGYRAPAQPLPEVVR